MFQSLAAEGRLIIPGQVAREFARNRPRMVGDLVQGLADTKSKVVVPPVGNYPLLAGRETYKLALEAFDVAKEASKAYQEAIEELQDDLSTLLTDDPIL